MIWFGSSAGVAITNKFPKARHVGRWVKNGWHVAVAYIIGFTVLYFTLGWEPADNREHKIVNFPYQGVQWQINLSPKERWYCQLHKASVTIDTKITSCGQRRQKSSIRH